jgi:hypothetical protein
MIASPETEKTLRLGSSIREPVGDARILAIEMLFHSEIFEGCGFAMDSSESADGNGRVLDQLRADPFAPSCSDDDLPFVFCDGTERPRAREAFTVQGREREALGGEQELNNFGSHRSEVMLCRLSGIQPLKGCKKGEAEAI